MTFPYGTQHDQAIRDAYERGESMNQIARRLGVSYTPIRNALLRQGVQLRPQGGTRADGNAPKDYVRRGPARAFSDEQLPELVRQYESGDTLPTIADRYGVTHPTVRAALLRAGATLRKVGQPAKWTPDLEAQILDLFRSGETSPARIAKRFGVGQQWTRRLLVQRGLLKYDPTAHPHYKGGRVKLAGGYIGVRPTPDEMHLATVTANGYCPEHRLVMARQLGRPLTKTETVHHINGDRTDNRPENLQLRQGRHGKGAAFTCLDCGSHNIEATRLGRRLRIVS